LGTRPKLAKSGYKKGLREENPTGANERGKNAKKNNRQPKVFREKEKPDYRRNQKDPG